MNADALNLIGRIFLALLFLTSGAAKIMDYQGVSQYMAGANMPMIQIALPIAIAMEIGGALGLILGFQTRLAALVLVVYTVVASWFFHNFWALSGQEAQMQMIQFTKNLALIGGLLVVMAAGAGRLSIDGRRR
mgnify:CR=1 FL=1